MGASEARRGWIAMVLPYSPLEQLAGLEFATVQAAKSLDGSGWHISLCCVGRSGLIEGVEILGYANLARLAWKVAFSPVEIVHFMEIWPTPLTRALQLAAGLMLRARGRIVITTVATYGNITTRTGSRLEARLWYSINKRIIGLNTRQRDELLKRGLLSDKFRVCPRGVPPSFEPPSISQRIASREALGLPSDKKLVLFLGRFVARKRVLALAKLWQHAGARLQDCALIMVGTGAHNDDSIEGQLRAVVERNPGNMAIFPWTSQPLAYLQACDVFVLPSEREGQPNALLQAMACGLGVVVSSSPGLTEIVEHNVTGLHAQTLCQVIDAIELLTRNDALCQNLGSNSAAYIQREHTMNEVRGFHAALYHELLD
jgi:glycosyltransferase involved in cell wall biosynthesis